MRFTQVLLLWSVVFGMFAPAARASDPPCEGSHVVMGPAIPAVYSGFFVIPALNRGIFFKALKDYQLCAIGLQIDVVDSLEVSLYAAHGTTQGALLARTHIFANSNSGDGAVWYFPISVSLAQCQDYEVVFTRLQFMSGPHRHDQWNISAFKFPFETGDIARVRAMSPPGDPYPDRLPAIELVGHATGSSTLSDLTPGVAPAGSASASGQRGFYVRALKDASIVSVGIFANVNAGDVLELRVYDGTGVVRNGFITKGRLVVPSGGLQWLDIPVNAHLLMGHFYEFSLSGKNPSPMNVSAWPYWSSSALPFSVGPFKVVQSSADFGLNDPANRIYHFRVQSSTPGCGFPFTFIKLTDGPPQVPLPSGFGQNGVYVRSLLPQEVYSVGLRASIPDGTPIIARVFASQGQQRGELLAEGVVFSTTAPPQPPIVPEWHDVPLPVDLMPGMEYDISIECPNIEQAFYWDDTSGMPFVTQGTTEVLTGESFGDPLSHILVELRMSAWNEYAVSVRKTPQRTPLFVAAPVPNPVSGRSRVDFSLDVGGPVTVSVYDVAGRRVTTLIDEVQSSGTHGLVLDTTRFPSGIYFLKAQTPRASASRKFVVMH